VIAVSQLNKQKVRLFVEAVLNEGRVELIDELVAVDFVGRGPCAERDVVGRVQLRRFVTDHRLAHPDMYIRIEDEIAEDDLVAMRWRATARMPESASTSNHTQFWEGISLVRLLAGRQVDSYTAVAIGR
jgi:predicted SnoaL-like aldol condensation-catalyzing enzyme